MISAAGDSPQAKRRGRPRKTATSAKDVLFLKGAAAQHTTHPGNLAFYALCEARFDEWSGLPDCHPARRQICHQIVDQVLENGGKFRKATGGVMPREFAVTKTRDRLRQIAIPKIRPDASAVSDNDVVFTRGAANHLYPGNAKWRTLLDGYVMEYFRDFLQTGGDKAKVIASSSGSIKKRPQYQNDVIERTIQVVHGWGGTFRDHNMNEIGHEEIAKKTHGRFRDLKKELRAGKVFPRRKAENQAAEDEDAEEEAKTSQQPPPIADESYILSRTGCTSVKATVASGHDLKNIKKEKKPRWKKDSRNTDMDSDEEDDGYNSSMFESDNHSDGEDDADELAAVDVDWKDMVVKRSSKRRQDMERGERLKRRRSASSLNNNEARTRSSSNKKHATRRRRSRSKPRSTKEEEETRPPSPEYELSAYERLRQMKIRRNQERLKQLGLLLA